METQQEKQLQYLVAKWESFFLGLPAPYRPFSLRGVTFRWNDRMRSRAGLCRPWDKMVELNPHLLVADSNALENVFIHELCHMAVGTRWPYAQPHGAKWKKLMEICGFRPQRCHTLTPHKRHTQRRWPLLCDCKEHQVSTVVYNRVKRGARYRCLDCKGTLKGPDLKIFRGFFSRIFS